MIDAFKRDRFRKNIILMFIAIFILAACALASEQSAESDRAPFDTGGFAEPAAEEPMEEVEAIGAPSFPEAPGAEPAPDFQAQVQEQLIIRTAQVTIEVGNTEEGIDRISQMAEASGGWVVSSRVFESGEAKRGSITIRVPAERFDSVMEEIRGLAVEVPDESISSQDVTEEYVDLQSRLENLEATADRVRDFLDQAQNVEEALAVNAELSRLEGEIEVIKGRMQYLEQSAAFSTISVDLMPDILSQPIEVGGWRLEGEVRDAVESLISGLQGLATILIWLVITVLPLLLIIALPLLLIAWLFRRWRRRRLVTE